MKKLKVKIKNMIKVSIEEAISTKSGTPKPYIYISIKSDDTELTRIFIKKTELDYYRALIGSYEKVEDLED